MRRHSYLESQKSNRRIKAFGISSRPTETAAWRGVSVGGGALGSGALGGPAWLLLNRSPP
jgi:hypothetical protein